MKPEEVEVDNADTVPCETCGGTQEIECETCDGSGNDCNYCGQGPCEVCDGRSVLPCPDCKEGAK